MVAHCYLLDRVEPKDEYETMLYDLLSIDKWGSEGLGELMGGALESSNVDVAEELISMIMAQRSYELTSKAISTSDEMLKVTNRLKA